MAHDQEQTGTREPQLDEGLSLLLNGEEKRIGEIGTWKAGTATHAELWQLDKGVTPAELETGNITIIQTDGTWNSTRGLARIADLAACERGRVWWCLVASDAMEVPTEADRNGMAHELSQGGVCVGTLFREKAGNLTTDSYLMRDTYQALKPNDTLLIGEPKEKWWADTIAEAGATTLYRVKCKWVKPCE